MSGVVEEVEKLPRAGGPVEMEDIYLAVESC